MTLPQMLEVANKHPDGMGQAFDAGLWTLNSNASSKGSADCRTQEAFGGTWVGIAFLTSEGIRSWRDWIGLSLGSSLLPALSQA
jgi:hypothetical protein